MTQRFDQFYASALKNLYDAERQQAGQLGSISALLADDRTLARGIGQLQRQAADQVDRLERVFAQLYLEPSPEPCWIVAALLREALDWAQLPEADIRCSGVAVALLSIKRYEITRYEALIAWSLYCGLDEALPFLNRSLAQEIVMSDVLGALSFDGMPAVIDAVSASVPDLAHNKRLDGLGHAI